MLALRLIQEGVAHEPGWAALLDPVFMLFSVAVALGLGIALYLVLRPDDDGPLEIGGEE